MELLNIPGKANFKSLGNSAKKAVLELIRSELGSNIAPTLIPTLFPINAIYSIMDPNFNPNVAWAASGTRWERLPDNHVLWTSSNPTANDVNANKIAAGLPNITGLLEHRNPSGGALLFSSSTTNPGAFKVTHKNSAVSWANALTTQSEANNLSTVVFNANNGASTKGIYGNSNTVQPPAIKYCAWIRVS